MFGCNNCEDFGISNFSSFENCYINTNYQEKSDSSMNSGFDSDSGKDFFAMDYSNNSEFSGSQI